MNIDTDETQNLIIAFSSLLLQFKEDVRNAIREMYPQYASQENLEAIGRGRNVQRYSGEALEQFRARVIDAFDYNRGLGRAEDIIRAITSLGYVFNSFIAGDISGGEGSFNLLVKTLGGASYDGSHTFGDEGILYNSVLTNDFEIEIVQETTPTDEQKEAIINITRPIIRASSKIRSISNITE